MCGKENDITETIPVRSIKDLSHSAVEHLIAGQWEEGITKLKQCEAVVAKNLQPPILELTEAQIAVWKAMWLKYGNMKIVKL